MSNWKKIDDTSVADYAAAASAIPSFTRRNIGAHVTSRHISAGMAYNFEATGKPIISSGSRFPVNVPFLIPYDGKWATTIECTLTAEAFDSDVDVSLVINGIEGSTVTWTATGSPQTKQISATVGPTVYNMDFYKAEIRVQSTAGSALVTVNAFIGSKTRLNLVTLAAGWIWGPGKCHAELELTNLANDSGYPSLYYFGHTQHITSGTGMYNDYHRCVIWPFLQANAEWPEDPATIALKAFAGKVHTMSSLEFHGLAFEIQGGNYDTTDWNTQPAAPLAAVPVLNMEDDLSDLRHNRSHWFSNSFLNDATAILTGNIQQIGYGAFGGNMPSQSAEQTPQVISSFPAERREDTVGLKIGVLWGQTGFDGMSRSIRINATIDGVVAQTQTFEGGEISTQERLYNMFGGEHPIIWGPEDSIGNGDIDKLTLSIFTIPWPSAIVVGSTFTVNLEIEDSGINNTLIHLYAISAKEDYLGGSR